MSNEQTFLAGGSEGAGTKDEPVGPFGVPLSKLYSYTMVACLVALVQMMFLLLICCYVKWMRSN